MKRFFGLMLLFGGMLVLGCGDDPGWGTPDAAADADSNGIPDTQRAADAPFSAMTSY